jgi:hypothetical protein
MNRNLWGVENFEEITIRHSKFAAQRFAHEAAPALTRFADSSPAPFITGIKAARERIVARTDEDRDGFLRKRGFSKSETAKIIETVLHEEGHPPASLFDFVQGITTLARGKAHQDARLELGGRAKRLLERASKFASRATGNWLHGWRLSRLTGFATFHRSISRIGGGHVWRARGSPAPGEDCRTFGHAFGLSILGTTRFFLLSAGR